MPTRNINNDLKVNANLSLNMDTNSLSGDSNGAVVLAGYDNLTFKTQSSPRVTINSSGDVGIGTTSPAEKLHVNGIIRTHNSTETKYINVFGGNSGNFIDSYGNSLYLRYGGDSSKAILLDSAGNVGIGTTSPDHTLRVNGDTRLGNLHIKTSDFGVSGTGKTIYADGAGAGVLGFISSTAFDFSNGTTSRLHINSSGNVGIGTTSPAYKLDVAGAIRTNSRFWASTGTSNETLLMGYWDAANARIESGAALPMLITSYEGNIKLGISGGTTMTVKSTAVGIGTTSPSAALDVVGSSKFRGTVNHSWFNYSTGEDTYIRGGKTTSKVHINDSHSADVLIAVGGGNVGIGTTTPSDKLDVNGVASASSYFKYKGHPLNMSYGQGGSDSVLFDYTHYSDNAFLATAADHESNTTSSSSEWVASSDHPFAGGKVLQSSGYRDFYSDYIPVTPGEELYGEIYTKYISGSGGVLYYGIERYDSEKNAIAGNAGTTYFVSSNFNATSTSWTKKSGYTTLPTTHTAYNGSNAGGCYYVRIRILFNYPSGGAVRQFGGIMLKRTGVAHDQLISGNVGVGTTSPSKKLEIASNTTYDGIQVSGTSIPRIAIIDTTNNATLSAYARDNDATIGTESNHPLTLNTNGTERMRISSAGAIKFNNYGAGTFTGTVTQKLGVDSSGNVIEMPIGAGPVDGSGTANYLARWIDSDTLGIGAAYDNGTNVGIGTTIPSKKLEVDVGGTSSDGILVVGSLNPHIEAKDSTNSVRTAIASEDSLGKVGTISSTDLKIVTSNSERIRVDTSGHVGIGTTGPSSLLHIADSGSDVKFTLDRTDARTYSIYTNSTSDLKIKDEDAGADRITIKSDGKVGINTGGTTLHNAFTVQGNANINNGNGAFLTFNNGDANITIHNNDADSVSGRDLSFKTWKSGVGNTEKLRITRDGNVGIGTDSPSAKLDVTGGNILISDTANDKYFGSNVNLILNADADGNSGDAYRNIIFQNRGSETARIDVSGNVGIGTTSPTHKLDVRGDIVVKGGSTQHSVIRFRRSDTTTDFGYIGFENPAAANDEFLISSAGNGNPIKIQAGASDTIHFYGNTIAYGGFNGDGNFGIGTTSPAYKLDVNGAARSSHFIDRSKGTGTTPATAGWYKIASWSTGGKRGGTEIKLSTTGGSFTPITWIIRCYKNWSTDATLKLEQYGYANVYFTKARIVQDTSTNILHLEVYQGVSTALTFNMYQTSLMGYDSFVTMATGALAAGTTGGTVCTELPFIASGTSLEDLYVEDNVGIGVPSPAQKLDVGGGHIRLDAGYSLQWDNSHERIEQSDGHLEFFVNNGESMTLDTNGLGIGTTSPSAKLDVVGGSELNGIVYITDSNDVPLRVRSSDGASMIGISDSNSTNDYSNGIGVYGNALHLTTNGNERIRIDASGNVGIGTASPTSPLSFGKSVYGAITSENFFRIKFKDHGGTANDVGIGQSDQNSLEFNKCPAGIFSFNDGTNGEVMRIHSNGNVGIGTPSPDAKLVAAGIVDGDFTALRLMNQKTYGSGTGTNEKVRFVMGISESGAAFSTREGFAIDVGVNNESDSSNAIVNFGVRDGGTLGTYQTVNGHNKSVDFVGNVGIGTTSTAAKLQVYSTATSNIFISGHGTSAQNTWAGEHAFFVNAGNGIIVGKANANNDTNRLYTFYNDAQGNAEQYIYNTSNVATIKLDSAGDTYFNGGNVGIGTTSPDEKLHVAGLEDGTPVKIQAAALNTVNGGAYSNYQELKFVADSSDNIPAGIRHLGNTWLSSDSALSFWTSQHGGSYAERMRIDGDGNVGIGTTSPSQKLDVVGNVEANTTNANFRALSGSVITKLQSQTSGATQGVIGTESANNLAIVTSNQTRMFINTSGDVGIGTTSFVDTRATGGLHLANATGIAFQSTSSNTNSRAWRIRNDDLADWGSLNFAVGTTNSDFADAATDVVMTMLRSGNVGIGTTGPSYKLDVNGTIGGNQVFIQGLKALDSAANFLYIDPNTQFSSGIYINNRVKIDGGLLGSYNEDLQLRTGDTTRLTLSSSTGNATFAADVDVDGITTSDAFRTDTSNTDYNVISRNSTSGSLYVQAAQSNSIQTILSCRYGSATVAQGTEVLAVRRNSSYFINTKLGIGTNNPGKTLDVSGEVRVSNGDLEVVGSSEGIILTAPSGGRYRISVNDSGELQTSAV